MDARTLARAVAPLRLAVVGMLLVTLDFNVGFVSDGTRYSVDLLNDSVGLLLVAVALGRLCTLKLGSASELLLTCLTGVVVVILASSVVKQVNPSVLESAATAIVIIRVVGIASMLIFCLTMRRIWIHPGNAGVDSWMK